MAEDAELSVQHCPQAILLHLRAPASLGLMSGPAQVGERGREGEKKCEEERGKREGGGRRSGRDEDEGARGANGKEKRKEGTRGKEPDHCEMTDQMIKKRGNQRW